MGLVLEMTNMELCIGYFNYQTPGIGFLLLFMFEKYCRFLCLYYCHLTLAIYIYSYKEVFLLLVFFFLCILGFLLHLCSSFPVWFVAPLCLAQFSLCLQFFPCFADLNPPVILYCMSLSPCDSPLSCLYLSLRNLNTFMTVSLYVWVFTNQIMTTCIRTYFKVLLLFMKSINGFNAIYLSGLLQIF